MSKKARNLLGELFGQLIVVAPAERIGEDLAYVCECSCGNEVTVRAGALTSGNTKSCGCRKKTRPDALIDMMGVRVGRLTVVGRAAGRRTGTTWLARCECGNEVEVLGANLRNGNSKSCGCLRSDKAKLTNLKHGRAHTLAYKRWESIKQRTSNSKNPSYRNYGGRGISMFPEWFGSFDAFLAGVGECPGSEFSLDRIDNDGNYEPGNVRWATRSQQMLNRRPIKRATLAELDVLRRRVAELEPALS